MTQPGIEPWSYGSLANTLIIRPMARYYYTLVDNHYSVYFLVHQHSNRSDNSQYDFFLCADKYIANRSLQAAKERVS